MRQILVLPILLLCHFLSWAQRPTPKIILKGLVVDSVGSAPVMQEVFKIIGQKPKGKKCEAIEGLSAEGEELMKTVKCKATLQAGLLSGAQAVEHYEIARYGTLIEWAKLLGHDDAAELLTETLFAAPVYKNYGAMIMDGNYSPPGFKMALGLKDNRLVQQAAEDLKVPLPFAGLVRDRFLAALANGDGDLDWSAIAKRAAADAGLDGA